MFTVKIDASGLTDLLGTPQAAARALKKAAAELTAQTREHIVEQANKKLKTRRQMYIDGLTTYRENEHTFVISLDAKVRWIDDGMSAHNMLDALLKSPKAKMTKDGTGKYLVVPFQHKLGPTQMTPAQANLNATIKAELNTINKERKKHGADAIPYGAIERHQDGSPKLGTLHSFDIMDRPAKTHEGPGQGWGPIGDSKQGPTGIPFLQGIQVRQRMALDKKGTEHVVREIMTFRVASSKHRDQGGRWDNPGTAPVPLMSEGADWAKQHWESVVKPKLFASIKAEL
jgi:hypothetical protein